MDNTSYDSDKRTSFEVYFNVVPKKLEDFLDEICTRYVPFPAMLAAYSIMNNSAVRAAFPDAFRIHKTAQIVRDNGLLYEKSVFQMLEKKITVPDPEGFAYDISLAENQIVCYMGLALSKDSDSNSDIQKFEKDVEIAYNMCKLRELRPFGRENFINILYFLSSPASAKIYDKVSNQCVGHVDETLPMVTDRLAAMMGLRWDRSPLVETILGDQSELIVMIAIDNLGSDVIVSVCNTLRSQAKTSNFRVILFGDKNHHPSNVPIGAELIFSDSGFQHIISDKKYCADAFIKTTKFNRNYVIGRVFGIASRCFLFSTIDPGVGVTCFKSVVDLYKSLL